MPFLLYSQVLHSMQKIATASIKIRSRPSVRFSQAFSSTKEDLTDAVGNCGQNGGFPYDMQNYIQHFTERYNFTYNPIFIGITFGFRNISVANIAGRYLCFESVAYTPKFLFSLKADCLLFQERKGARKICK